METTTIQCQLCEDRGVIHTEHGFGFGFSRCDCKTPEYWAERLQQRTEVLNQMLHDIEQKLG